MSVTLVVFSYLFVVSYRYTP